MKIHNDLGREVFQASLENARTINVLSANISCEGLRNELRYLASWITLHTRKAFSHGCSSRETRKLLKEAGYLSQEIGRCLLYAHDTGYLSTSNYRTLDENYRCINAQICQWEQRTDAHRWLGRIIRLYHGEKMKKGGSAYEKNDRFSIDGSDGLIEFSRVRAKCLRYEKRKEIPSSRL